MFVDENENDGDDLTSAASFVDPTYTRSQQARLNSTLLETICDS